MDLRIVSDVSDDGDKNSLVESVEANDAVDILTQPPLVVDAPLNHHLAKKGIEQDQAPSETDETNENHPCEPIPEKFAWIHPGVKLTAIGYSGSAISYPVTHDNGNNWRVMIRFEGTRGDEKEVSCRRCKRPVIDLTNSSTSSTSTMASMIVTPPSKKSVHRKNFDESPFRIGGLLKNNDSKISPEETPRKKSRVLDVEMTPALMSPSSALVPTPVPKKKARTEKYSREKAKRYLQMMPGKFPPGTLDAALDAVGRPWGLQNVVERLQKILAEKEKRKLLEKEDPDSQSDEPLETERTDEESFCVTIGMEIRKTFENILYAGNVKYEVKDEVVRDGKAVKVWRVQYTDGDGEDLEKHELYLYRFPKPESEPFRVTIGMAISKSFGGKKHAGKVVEEIEELVIKDGKLVKVWRVEYTDEDTEDLERHELYQYRFPKPEFPPSLGRKLQCLELFSGQGIVSQEFGNRNWKTCSIDILPTSNADIKMDILHVENEKLPLVPDFMWASPPCHTYSKAAGGLHRCASKGELEKTQEALDHNYIFMKMVDIMTWAKRKHPHLIVVIENPVGGMKHMPLMHMFKKQMGLKEVTVDYCAFGRNEKKPTMLWTNSVLLAEHLEYFSCKKCCCVSQDHLSVQSNISKFDFSSIPEVLASEVARVVDSKLFLDKIPRTDAASPTSEI